MRFDLKIIQNWISPNSRILDLGCGDGVLGRALLEYLGPVTAFDELRELELAGRLGWRTVEAGMLRHRMVRTPTQWEHRRVVWTGPLRRLEQDGWQVGCRAFPWVYLIRDLGVPAEQPAVSGR